MPTPEVQKHILDAAVIALGAHPDYRYLAFHFEGGDDSGCIDDIYLSKTGPEEGLDPSYDMDHPDTLPIHSTPVGRAVEVPLDELLSMEFGGFDGDSRWRGWYWLDFEKGTLCDADVTISRCEESPYEPWVLFPERD